jgi:hypothetical protein
MDQLLGISPSAGFYLSISLIDDDEFLTALIEKELNK